MILHPGQIYPTANIPDEMVQELLNKFNCQYSEPQFTEKIIEIKNYIVRRSGALGDVLILRAIFQTYADKTFIFITNQKYFELFDLKNVKVVDITKESQYMNYPNSVYYNLDGIRNPLELSPSFDLVEIFLKFLKFEPKPLNWGLLATEKAKGDIDLMAYGFNKRRKKVVLQFCGSWAMRNIPPKTMEEIINLLIKKKYAVAVIGDDIQYKLESKSGLFDLRGQTKLQHIPALLESADAIISLDSSLVYFAHGCLHANTQLLFAILGPNLGYPRVRHHPHGSHVSLAEPIGCYPCMESTERCGRKGIPKCLAEADAKYIVDMFDRNYKLRQSPSKEVPMDIYYNYSEIEYMENTITFDDVPRDITKKYPEV